MGKFIFVLDSCYYKVWSETSTAVPVVHQQSTASIVHLAATSHVCFDLVLNLRHMIIFKPKLHCFDRTCIYTFMILTWTWNLGLKLRDRSSFWGTERSRSEQNLASRWMRSDSCAAGKNFACFQRALWGRIDMLKGPNAISPKFKLSTPNVLPDTTQNITIHVMSLWVYLMISLWC